MILSNAIKEWIQMLNNDYTSLDILEFLKGRDYLLSQAYLWINGQGYEIAITSMPARYQLNCINWLVICLEDLQEEIDEVKDEMKPLIINKMENFKEIFPIVVKKETAQLRDDHKEQYKELKNSFKEKLRKV